MQIKASSIKLEEFNSCDPARVAEALKATTLAYPCDVVGNRTWCNSRDTLVVQIPTRNRDIKEVVKAIVALSNAWSYDDMVVKFWRESAIIRMWYD